MRRLWSENEKHRLWRRIWVELARAEEAAGLVSAEQRAALEAAANNTDEGRLAAIEAEIQHDLMAAVRAFAEQAPPGGPIIHLGATSADIEDNADALRIRQAMHLIEARLAVLLHTLAGKALDWCSIPVMGFTHLQPAEPTTAGYRMALHLQDLNLDYTNLRRERLAVRGKGFKGAVGTAASYNTLLAGTSLTAPELEARIMASLGLEAFPITGQTYPRKQDWRVISALAGLASSLSRLAYDLRLLQSPLSGELSEPFGAWQVGSSAMPFKRNPIASEKVDSLGRLVASFVDVAWQNATLSFLERTLDDSANRREMFPVAFLAAEEMLITMERVVRGLRFDQVAARRTFDRFSPFAATEPVLMAAVRAGADRQAVHEHLRELSMQAWAAVQEGKSNPLPVLMQNSEALLKWLSPGEIARLSDPTSYLGTAPERAREFALNILAELDASEE
ncbi:MAG: adenylosuccinate lyase [Anaerolineae bacterium]|nr:adenylosuccinate lyase [Anaerolineae bacterium]